MITESARYFALCDAYEAFAHFIGPKPTEADARTLEVLEQMVDEYAAKTREALKPVGFDIVRLAATIVGVRP